MNPFALMPGIDRAHPAMILLPPDGPLPAAEVAMERWRPSRTFTKKEQFILKRLATKRKLFAFLRNHRHEIFDEEFQAELESMYRDTGAGKEPKPPVLMAMALVLQGYTGLSDSDAVEATVLDLRWQLVLDTLGEDEPAFSQGTLQAFRERLIAHDMDRRVLERTVELAKATKKFDWKKLPKTLRVAMDSSPLEGAGRVEDAPPGSPLPSARSPGSLPRHPEEPLRPPPRLRHPEPGDDPAKGRVMRSLSNRSSCHEAGIAATCDCSVSPPRSSMAAFLAPTCRCM